MRYPLTQNYLNGIKEGREYFKQYGKDFSLAEIKSHIENIKNQIKNGNSDDMRDFLRGERDFWINQLKIRGAKC